MSELKFTCVNNEQYNTVSINIENAIIEIKNEDYYIFDKQKTKFGYKKVNLGLHNNDITEKLKTLGLHNNDITEKLKTWETEINEYLKNEMGTSPVKIVYGYKLYTKHYIKINQEENKYFIKISGVWINENNKPFVQLYYIEHMVSIL